ncbi:MAG: tetratricopeptide repeat protein [Arenimonas sp.]
MNLVKMLVIVFLLLAASPCLSAEETKVDAKKVADSEIEQQNKLVQAQKLIASGKQREAIALLDETLAYYEARYPAGKTRWYVARTTRETVVYLTGVAIFGDKTDKRDAMALSVAWADAYFLKGYAYIELGQLSEAKAAIEQALTLSPKNANYLVELAEIAKLERNWGLAYEYYKEAESASDFSPEDEKLSDLSHAKRGQAFVFIEQGKLDEAEKVLKECLKLNKNDKRAQEELDYIKKLRN